MPLAYQLLAVKDGREEIFWRWKAHQTQVESEKLRRDGYQVTVTMGRHPFPVSTELGKSKKGVERLLSLIDGENGRDAEKLLRRFLRKLRFDTEEILCTLTRALHNEGVSVRNIWKEVHHAGAADGEAG